MIGWFLRENSCEYISLYSNIIIEESVPRKCVLTSGNLSYVMKERKIGWEHLLQVSSVEDVVIDKGEEHA